jgi:hypothetical protein
LDAIWAVGYFCTMFSSFSTSSVPAVIVNKCLARCKFWAYNLTVTVRIVASICDENARQRSRLPLIGKERAMRRRGFEPFTFDERLNAEKGCIRAKLECANPGQQLFALERKLPRMRATRETLLLAASVAWCAVLACSLLYVILIAAL